MNRDKHILGIHIDDHFLNIVHLGQTANGLNLRNWAAEHLETGAVKEGLIVNEQTVSQKIREFIKTNHIKTYKAILSLSCSSVRLKPSEFEAQTDEQLRKQVEEQVGKYGLFEGEKIVFDYCTFEHSAQSSDKQTVLQAVTTRQISDACLATARKAGLKLVRMEPAVLPIIKLALNKESACSQVIYLLLVLDSTSTNLSVFKNGLPQFCQNLTIGVKDLLQNKGGLTQLTDQMQPVLQFARSLADSQQIMLGVSAACDSEKLETIISQLKENLSDLEIEQIDQTRIIKEFNIQGVNGGLTPFFALSSALTFFGITAFNRQMNLLSQESLALQKTMKEMSLTAKAVAAVILLSVAILFPLKMKIKSVEAFSADVEMKLTETIPMTEKINKLKKQTEQLTEKLSAYDVNDKNLTHIPWTKILQIIGDVAPNKVRITEISTSNTGDFTLIGEAIAERYVYKFAEALQDNKPIKNVKVEEIEYGDNNTANIVNYKISCRTRIPEGDL